MLGAITFEELAENYYAQAKALVEGGVDVLLVETAQDILEVKAAVAGFERLFAEIGQPRRRSRRRSRSTRAAGCCSAPTWRARSRRSKALRVDVIGLNCSTGPEHMREPVRYLTEHATRPDLRDSQCRAAAQHRDRRCGLSARARAAGERRSRSSCAISACASSAAAAAPRPSICGRSCEAVRPLADGATRGLVPTDGDPRVARVSSAMRAITLHQDPPPLLVGERVNAQGSRAVKRLLLADDYDGIVRVARDQAESGAHVLDVCVALTERADEAEQMARVVKLLSMSVDTPLVIDSTEPAVIAAALAHLPGRGIVNSINMENGRKRIDDVLPLVRRHGAAVVALTIDEQGMARTRDRKLEIARRIHDIATSEFGLASSDLIFDALTFTLATGEAEWIDSATETIEGIRLIKRELPGVFTILGVSNVSFGLTTEARAVLNSVFLHHCVSAGLDAAIVNPAHIRPYAEVDATERALADDLVFNRRPDALQRFIEHFASAGGDGRARRAGEAAADPTAGMTADQRIHWSIVHRKKEGIEELLDAAGVREQPVRVLNEVLLPAMKEVGDKFGAGELILPFVLQSAEVMKRAVRHLEQFLERSGGLHQGQGRAGHGVRRRPRHREVARQHDPLEQRLYGLRPRQAGPGQHDHRESRRRSAPTRSGCRRCWSRRRSRCRCACRSSTGAGSRIRCSSAVPRSIGDSAGERSSSKASGRTRRACSTARMRSRGWRRWTQLMDPAAPDAAPLPTLIDAARHDVFLHTTVGKDIAAGTTGGRAEQRARR